MLCMPGEDAEQAEQKGDVHEYRLQYCIACKLRGCGLGNELVMHTLQEFCCVVDIG